eukprot:589442-Pelagomonas_calceolata.AAC.2
MLLAKKPAGNKACIHAQALNHTAKKKCKICNIQLCACDNASKPPKLDVPLKKRTNTKITQAQGTVPASLRRILYIAAANADVFKQDTEPSFVHACALSVLMSL